MIANADTPLPAIPAEVIDWFQRMATAQAAAGQVAAVLSNFASYEAAHKTWTARVESAKDECDRLARKLGDLQERYTERVAEINADADTQRIAIDDQIAAGKLELAGIAAATLARQQQLDDLNSAIATAEAQRSAMRKMLGA